MNSYAKVLVLFIFLSMGGCGVHTSYAERYVPDSNIKRDKENPFGMDILIHPTHRLEDGSFLIGYFKMVFSVY